MSLESPVFGRRSPAAAAEPILRPSGDAAVSTWRAEGGSTAWCTVRAASVTGVRHRLSGRPGEDSFAWSHDDSRLVVAVADGLGSVEGSAGAAGRATAAAAGVIAAGDSDSRGATMAEAVRAANEAAAGGGATTLVVAVLDRSGQVDLGRVGDSTAFLIESGGVWCELFRPPEDDAVGTETQALPSLEPQLEACSVTIGPADVLVLATDGVADPWRDGPETVAPSLAEAMAARPGPLELARLADFSRQGCHDDRTIMVVWLATRADETVGHPPASGDPTPGRGH
jgi:serine/threonine protein phosphatase PrpC